MGANDGLIKQIFTYKNYVHAIAGATGSVVGLSTFYPLDTVRTRLQVDEKFQGGGTLAIIISILKKEGLWSLYRGWFPVVSSLCCSNFVYFYVYNCLKLVFHDEGAQANAAKDLSIAFAAGCVNVLATTPLWVVNTRLKLQGIKIQDGKDSEKAEPHYKGIWDCLCKIMKNEGVGRLWSGTVPSLILVSNPSVQFMIYEMLKRYAQKVYRTKELSGVIYFLLGAVAKAVATLLTYPIQLIQTKLRAGRRGQQYQKKGITEILKEIARDQGVSGLYKGLEAKMLQTVLMAALMFVTYEKIASFVFQLLGEEFIPKR